MTEQLHPALSVVNLLPKLTRLFDLNTDLDAKKSCYLDDKPGCLHSLRFWAYLTPIVTTTWIMNCC